MTYGDDPTVWLEPINASNTEDVLGYASTITATQSTGGIGRVANVRFIQGRYSRFHSYDDVDFSNINVEPNLT